MGKTFPKTDRHAPGHSLPRVRMSHTADGTGVPGRVSGDVFAEGSFSTSEASGFPASIQQEKRAKQKECSTLF